MSINILNKSNNLFLAQTLTDLIERESKLTPAALARKLGIPTNKITRILNGDVTDPKASTLLQIANYFGISIEQLLGMRPMVQEETSGAQAAATHSVPIYELSSPMKKTKKWHQWISNEIAGEYYALAIDTDLYEPTFPQNSLLIVNSNITADDRSYIVVTKINHPKYCSIKKYVLEGDQIYLYPINPKLQVEVFDENFYTIEGVILEVHLHLKK